MFDWRRTQWSNKIARFTINQGVPVEHVSLWAENIDADVQCLYGYPVEYMVVRHGNPAELVYCGGDLEAAVEIYGREAVRARKRWDDFWADRWAM